MDNDKVVEIAAQLTHSFFLHEFVVAKSNFPKKEVRKDTEKVVKEIFEEYIKDILKNPLESLKHQ